MVTVRLPFCSTSTLSIGRERENKLKKKMCKKKEKKRLNCFCFFFGNMSPFPFFPYSWFPNPKCCISSAPTPKVPSSGVGLGQEVVRETVTGRGNTQDRDQERHGVRGRQAGRRTMPSGLWLGGHRGGSGGTRWSPLALSAALLPEPGAQGRKLSSSRGLGAQN